MKRPLRTFGMVMAALFVARGTWAQETVSGSACLFQANFIAGMKARNVGIVPVQGLVLVKETQDGTTTFQPLADVAPGDTVVSVGTVPGSFPLLEMLLGINGTSALSVDFFTAQPGTTAPNQNVCSDGRAVNVTGTLTPTPTSFSLSNLNFDLPPGFLNQLTKVQAGHIGPWEAAPATGQVHIDVASLTQQPFSVSFTRVDDQGNPGTPILVTGSGTGIASVTLPASGDINYDVSSPNGVNGLMINVDLGTEQHNFPTQRRYVPNSGDISADCWTTVNIGGVEVPYPENPIALWFFGLLGSCGS